MLYIIMLYTLCDHLPLSPARLPGVESVQDLLLKDLEEKSWTESNDLDLRIISQLIGFVLIKSFK